MKMFGGPLIIIDFGTATTFCAIADNGDYLGGAISPGIGISTEALFQRAAKLPRIELVQPKQVICRNTVSSMQSGIIFGFTGQVDEIVRRMKEELGSDAYVVGTGGLANLIAQNSTTINVVEHFLTLKDYAYSMNEIPKLTIGGLVLANPVILAPMAGVTDLPFDFYARNWVAVWSSRND